MATHLGSANLGGRSAPARTRPLRRRRRRHPEAAQGDALKPRRALDEIIRISDSITAELVAPPSPGEAASCPYCATWNKRLPEPHCTNCQDNIEVLGGSPLPIDVITLVRKPSNLRDWLTQYKGRATDDDPLIEEYIPIVRALLGRWLLENDATLTRRWGGIDALVVIPSTRRDLPVHPLESILLSLDPDTPVRQLLRRGPGEIGWRQPAMDGFIAEGGTPLRVTLVDDVYVTGARANSAAATLGQAGHDVAGVIEIARRINPDFDPGFKTFWDTQAASPFSWQSERAQALT